MILVTGGAGFIGSHFILDWFERCNEPVLNVDCLNYAANLQNLVSLKNHPSYYFIQGDIRDPSLWSELFERYQPRAIIHFAAESHVDRSILDPESFVSTNVLGTVRLLESSLRYWRSLPSSSQAQFRFLHISTDEVYGSLAPDAPAFTEHHAYQPNSPYAASKAASDHFVRAYYHTYGLPVLTTHCSNNYGPYQFPEKLIPLVILNAIQQKTLPIYGDGQQIRDWLYAGDHCAALRCVLDQGQVGEVYNIGGLNEKTNLAVVQMICKILDDLRPLACGRSYAEQIRFVEDRPGHDQRYAINATKLCEAFDWRPAESFESGLLKTVQWYLSHPEWVEHINSGQYRQWMQQHYQHR